MTPFDISALPGKKRALYHICVLLIYALIGWEYKIFASFSFYC